MQRPGLRKFLFAALLLALPLILAVFAFALPPQYDETYLGGLADKMEALRAAEGPRIVLAGGSGAAFAVRSDLLEQEFPGRRVVNLGMYAGLGSTVPLEIAERELREGDIVLFLPEMSAQTLSLFFGDEAMWQAADGHWELLLPLDASRKEVLLGCFPSFAAKKAACFFRGDKPAGDGVYTRASFNAHGDIDSDLRQHNTMPGGYDPDQPVDFTVLNPAEDFVDFVNACAWRCEEKGVRFFFAFAPVNSAAADASGGAAFTERLRQNLTCPVLGSADECLMDPGWFFDTNFHLNSAGAVAYTAKLSGWLKATLGLAPETAIVLPEMPSEGAEAVFFRGDDTDSALFLYEEREGGLWVTGLRPEGMERKSLILPTAAEGKPVLGFDAAVFAGNTALETLSLQANLRHIPDGAFAGCTGLREVRLLDVAPSACTVGQDLLRGTDAWIVVSPERLAAYMTDYFWAMHAPRIRAGAAEKTPVPALTEAPAAAGVRYDGNGGLLSDGSGAASTELPITDAHLRQNAPDALLFTRPGFVLAGWNTRPDGSGEETGPGWRFEAQPGMTLYAHWLAETPEDRFTWEEQDGEAWITGWQGTEETCVLPEQLGQLPLRGIRSGAFRGASLDMAVIPPAVRVIEPEAFAGCSMRTLYLFDSLETVSDAAFTGCGELRELRIGAASPPVYSISYYATFADKYDRLLSLRGGKKLVLFSGSSTRYGYDSAALERNFPEYRVVNMGVYAYTNALPQMELILREMEAGDVLLHAPEFDCLNFQACENNLLDFHFWAMMEADYGCASLLDLRDYSRVFDSLQQYLTIRRSLPGRSYTETPNGYDDDGNFMNMPTYNEYGDIITLRANNKVDIMLKYVRADYTAASFPAARLESLNREYRRFLDRGIRVLFTYTPRNRSSITEESTPENRAALHRLLKESLCVPVISNIEDSLMSGEFFFVIDSHLSNEGVRLHTLQIIEDLKPWLNGGAQGT